MAGAKELDAGKDGLAPSCLAAIPSQLGGRNARKALHQLISDNVLGNAKNPGKRDFD